LYYQRMSNRKLRIVLVFGLGDDKFNASALLRRVWNSKTVQLYPLIVDWRDGGEYAPKLAKLLALIDELLTTGDPVALIGMSAGASLVTTAYALRPQLVGVVDVCGALRLGDHLPAKFAKSVGSSAAFEESLQVCEDMQRSLTANQLARILIMEPWRDFVPIATMQLEGARMHRIAGINHTLSIIMAMLFYRRTMLRFLKQTV